MLGVPSTTATASSSSDSGSGNGMVTDTCRDAAMALQQAVRSKRLVAYYTHPHRVPVTQSRCVRTEEHQQLTREEAITAPGDFAFLPFPAYCGSSAVDKVLYEHRLGFDVAS